MPVVVNKIRIWDILVFGSEKNYNIMESGAKKNLTWNYINII